jgi:hypothetical protein
MHFLEACKKFWFANIMHIGLWKQNVGDNKQVLHLGFEAKHEFQLEKTRLGFRVHVGFTLLSNAWLWLL